MGLKGLPNVLDVRPVGLTGIDLPAPDAVGKRGIEAPEAGFFEHIMFQPS
jgi:hypothetical protein